MENNRMNLTCFPDGTLIDPWFTDTAAERHGAGGVCFRVQDYGIRADGTVQTGKLQSLIDDVSAQGGGTIVISEGTFVTGAVYLKPGVHLHLEKDGVLKGSDDIRDYPLCETRSEG